MNKRIVCALAVFCAITAGCRNMTSLHDPQPKAWAAPAQAQGLDNFYKVDDALYRGAQPSPQGLKALREMGIKTVVNLRSPNGEEQTVRELGMNYVGIPMSAFKPSQEQVVAFLKVMGDPANYPVFVHCRHGADRTGLMTAMYRVVVRGWDKAEAIREFTEGGYNFNSMFKNLPVLVNSCDVDGLREACGMHLSDSRLAATDARPLSSAVVGTEDQEHATVTP